MELKSFINKALNLSNNVKEIEKAIIYNYITLKKIDYSKSTFFNKYLKEINVELVNAIKIFYQRKNIDSIYSLIEIFELLVPENEKKINGMVYTPKEIKDFILQNLLSIDKLPTICDPACGCGSFLLSAAEYVHEKFKVSYSEIYKKTIYGVDIITHNIEKANVLLKLLALENGEVIEGKLNLYAGDSLSIEWEKVFKVKGFDYVIGNPPYVRSKNISNEIKKELKKWNTCKIGNVDLYIPFYELGLKILNSYGKLGYISVNSYLISLNGRGLRNYLNEEKFETRILDFKDTQIFKKVTSYTCITFINKSLKNGKLYYAVYNDNIGFNEHNYSEFNFAGFEQNASWKLSKYNTNSDIHKIENIGVKLGSYRIKNGLATLKNDIYFFKPIKEDEHYYIRKYNDKEYKIEKDICINVIKPNVIKNEKDLKKKMEKGIFPYRDNKVIPETRMIEKYPQTYKFLKDVSHMLGKRDKGAREYPEWYAYGRTQGMNNFGKKLLIPYIAGEPIAIICEDESVLFYCGYAIFSNDTKELKILKKILESDVFWYYMKTTSKPYANGYVSFAKNYIKEFGIPKLTEEDKKSILKAQSKKEVNLILNKLYGLNLVL